MLTLLIGGWQRVVYSAALEVTDILSYRDKHTDRIIQLNCNRILLTPSQAEGYANKLLPHCPVWRSIPHYPAQLWARDQDSSDLRSSADVVVKLGEHLKRTTQTCRLTFFFFSTLCSPRGKSPSLSLFKPPFSKARLFAVGGYANTTALPDCGVSGKRCTVGNDRTTE